MPTHIETHILQQAIRNIAFRHGQIGEKAVAYATSADNAHFYLSHPAIALEYEQLLKQEVDPD